MHSYETSNILINILVCICIVIIIHSPIDCSNKDLTVMVLESTQTIKKPKPQFVHIITLIFI